MLKPELAPSGERSGSLLYCGEDISALTTAVSAAENLGLVDLHLAGLLLLGLGENGVLLVDAAHFLDAVDFGDADTADLAIDQHLAGTAFANTAVEASVAAVERVAVDGITGLVKGCGDGLAALTFDGLAFILEFHKVFLRDVQDGVFFDFVHIECVFES